MSIPALKKPAFAADAREARLRSAAKAAWWSANLALGRAVVRARADRTDAAAAGAEAPPASDAPPPPAGALRRAWLEAFAKDSADVAAGLYPFTEAAPADPLAALRRTLDLIEDGQAVEARRRRGDGVEARADAPSDAYPAYYRQNFHFQSGGWFTQESAERYEAQVEALFSGAAGPMRRRALSLLARAWKDRDQRGLRIVDLACGSGAFLADLQAAFPRARLYGLDLSHAYAVKAGRRVGGAMVQAAAERLPFADASLDAISCVFLFHELPPRVRPEVAGEIARVLKPGGVLAFADSVQGSDAPEFARLLDLFPALFHEPFYASYQSTDLPALFGAAGLQLEGQDQAFLTKALLLRKG